MLIALFSCGNGKVIQLPEINNSEITEINDVSAAYLFYDETKKDSVELNRKNLISTTNWLINVDKRLTLKQVIPHIKFLQDKKKNAGHKNENAKNYFTCNDTSRSNLGFIEFTDVVYHNDDNEHIINSDTDLTNLIVSDLNHINIVTMDNRLIKTNKTSLIKIIKDSLISDSKQYVIYLGFTNNLTFQDYISIKSALSKIKKDNIKISNHEGITN